ncbi:MULTISPECIES: C40 family peptidase [Deinococcus]|uniref:NLP/P60 protein n=1 Tax=Deinococcus geothermalis (strain DSM 11300 / CIP 105573 / AG-3a) TaxID=319795 RepID=Q1IY35_DEIGD|nr:MULTISPECIES: LysM peptidoglycan-binding domain-containing C40 family peptidase [Deinococcus]ABF45849.1 NLP/P60 protein [Deinococcus geothermalis DSM 11300]MBI0446102.1 peptidoglycan endopeptidase [Deinococcus sp. DB0503]
MKAFQTLLVATALCSGGAFAASYTVKPGDTLSSIASRYKLEPAQLMRLNGLSSTTIQVGQKLNVGGAQAQTATKTPAPVARTSTSGGAFIRTAATRFLGIRYVLGGTGNGGIDCSGFTMRVFQQLGIKLPHSAAGQWRMGYAVNSRNLQPGDLVFFNTLGRGVSHVGVYVGDGLMANANSYQGRTVIEPLFSNPYWASRYLGARRVLS